MSAIVEVKELLKYFSPSYQMRVGEKEISIIQYVDDIIDSIAEKDDLSPQMIISIHLNALQRSERFNDKIYCSHDNFYKFGDIAFNMAKESLLQYTKDKFPNLDSDACSKLELARIFCLSNDVKFIMKHIYSNDLRILSGNTDINSDNDYRKILQSILSQLNNDPGAIINNDYNQDIRGLLYRRAETKLGFFHNSIRYLSEYHLDALLLLLKNFKFFNYSYPYLNNKLHDFAFTLTYRDAGVCEVIDFIHHFINHELYDDGDPCFIYLKRELDKIELSTFKDKSAEVFLMRSRKSICRYLNIDEDSESTRLLSIETLKEEIVKYNLYLKEKRQDHLDDGDGDEDLSSLSSASYLELENIAWLIESGKMP
jgi:hypothetical protein